MEGIRELVPGWHASRGRHSPPSTPSSALFLGRSGPQNENLTQFAPQVLIGAQEPTLRSVNADVRLTCKQAEEVSRLADRFGELELRDRNGFLEVVMVDLGAEEQRTSGRVIRKAKPAPAISLDRDGRVVWRRKVAL